MDNSYHGHEVMRMIIESGKRFTKNALIEEIESTFGSDARFHTCSDFNMTAADLIDFLDARGKFITYRDGFTTTKENICNH
jgi:probable metal-binding protein